MSANVPPVSARKQTRSSGWVIALALGGAIAALIVAVIAFHWLAMRLCEGVAALTDAEEVLAAGEPTAGIFFVALAAFIGLGSIAYLAMLCRPSASADRPSMVPVIAGLLCVINVLLLIVMSPGRGRLNDRSIAGLIESDSDVDELTAQMLQQVVVSAWLTLVMLLIIWGLLRRYSFKVRVLVGVPAFLGVVAFATLMAGQSYVQ